MSLQFLPRPELWKTRSLCANLNGPLGRSLAGCSLELTVISIEGIHTAVLVFSCRGATRVFYGEMAEWSKAHAC